jgi:ornithine cyclodeaminase/alanine dehydrogenase-like protein (mu-crystallin family)
MEVLIVSQTEVPELLPMGECIEVVEHAFAALAQGDAVLPLRPVLWLPDREGLLCMMPTYLGNIKSVGAKVFSVFTGNHGTQYDVHQGVVLLFETTNGCLKAIVDATSITAIRTAAASAVATKLLARPDAADLAILGSGTQARAHLEAMLLVRPIRRVRVWSLPLEHGRQFAERESARLGIPVEAMNTARAAVVGADLICTTTPAREPILMGGWLSPGTHINAIGSSVPTTRELDTEAVVMSRLFVDRRESTVNEAGDFLFPKKEGAIDDDHILGEIGDILVGKIEGRRSRDEITLFKSLGLAIEDLASAHHVYRKAKAQRVGTYVSIGGRHHAST